MSLRHFHKNQFCAKRLIKAADFSDTGRGIRATRDIETGERILELAECFIYTGSEQVYINVIPENQPPTQNLRKNSKNDQKIFFDTAGLRK